MGRETDQQVDEVSPNPLPGPEVPTKAYASDFAGPDPNSPH